MQECPNSPRAMPNGVSPRENAVQILLHHNSRENLEQQSPGSQAGSAPGSPRPSLRASVELDPLNKLLRKNKAWSAARLAEDPGYFQRLIAQQAPEYLWIGCSDSRVPANAILGLAPGEVFVQRNVGNQATHTDLNCMSCLEYAVKELKVRNVIVCGHYGCGAVKAAIKMPSKTQNLVNCWISDIRECRNEHRTELMALPTTEAQVDRLCELNVLRQTFNVCTSPVVQHAWDQGQQLFIYGVVYSLKDGLMRKLVGPISKTGDFEMDQSSFIERGSSYIDVGMSAAAAAMNMPDRRGGSSAPRGAPGSVVVNGRQQADSMGDGLSPSGGIMAMSFRSRMEAFNAYMNTMQVNNRIAEHVGWTDEQAEHSALNGAAAAAALAATAAAGVASGDSPRSPHHP
ncbi:hypothetical protein CHLRE_13g607350v5 [Chlamydomonas reinhardtii]|uniref:Carbonic anhydrase n=1 Tax=Chlamydomonas reinhardtii TaxID=3055 RepID=A0A2K3D1I6_CHLRE|nr:uncharacterized protein CHLRE_13g607350v5 [Chlamydomonas reinhardtii]PNW74408.1 hypothetical protein CHLRE_13g607350v5 [Chlamydomonas reinhardtii]